MNTLASAALAARVVSADLDKHELLAVLALLGLAGPDGRTSAPQSAIAEAARLSVRAFFDALRSLEERGVVTVSRRGRLPEYEVHLDALTSARGADSAPGADLTSARGADSAPGADFATRNRNGRAPAGARAEDLDPEQQEQHASMHACRASAGAHVHVREDATPMRERPELGLVPHQVVAPPTRPDVDAFLAAGVDGVCDDAPMPAKIASVLAMWTALTGEDAGARDIHVARLLSSRPLGAVKYAVRRMAEEGWGRAWPGERPAFSLRLLSRVAETATPDEYDPLARRDPVRSPGGFARQRPARVVEAALIPEVWREASERQAAEQAARKAAGITLDPSKWFTEDM